MAVRFNLPIIAFDDSDGNPLAGGHIQFYEAGGTSTPKDTYTLPDLVTPNQNVDLNASDPTLTGMPLDSAGRHDDIWCDLSAGDYCAVVLNSFGTIIKTIDPVFGAEITALMGVPNTPPLYVFWEGKPSAGEVYPIVNITETRLLPSGLTGSIFTIDPGALPTATMTFTLKKNTSSIGTVALATNGSPTVTFSSQVTFNAGDQFSITAPGSQDATGENIAMSFVWTIV